MKRCPSCRNVYGDDTLSFCLQDGTPLTSDEDTLSLPDAGSHLYGARPRSDPPPTEILYPEQRPTARAIATEEQRARVTELKGAPLPPKAESSNARIIAISVLITLLLLGMGAFGAWLFLRDNSGADNRNLVSDNKPVTEPVASPSVSPQVSVSSTPGPAAAPTPKVEATKPAPVPKAGGWFVVLGSYPKSQMNKANERLGFLQARGYDAYIIDTDNYPNLSGGLWAVVTGPYAKKDAQDAANRMRSINPERPYIKLGQ